MQCLINGRSKSNDTYQLMHRARVHIENKKEIRNYDVKPFETDKKMKKDKQATTKTSFPTPIRLEDQYCGDSHSTKRRRRL